MSRISTTPAEKIKILWNKYLEKIEKIKPKVLKDLNKGCVVQDIKDLELAVNIKFPSNLQGIYEMNDGQKGNEEGVFFFDKSVFNMAIGLVKGCRLLSLKEITIEWKKLMADKELEVYRSSDMPFAKDNGYDYLCFDINTGNIVGLWIGGPDWTLPRDWQVDRKILTQNLEEFLKIIYEKSFNTLKF